MQTYSRLYSFDIYPILENSVSVLTARDLLVSEASPKLARLPTSVARLWFFCLRHQSGQNLSTKTLPLGTFSDKSSIVELVGRRNAVNSPKVRR